MTPHVASWRSILLLSSHLRLDLASGLFFSGFPTKTLYKHLLYSICATIPAHLILDLIPQVIFGEGNWSLSSTLCSFLHSPVTSSFLGTNVFFSTLFSNTLSLHSSLNVSDQCSQPYKTAGKTTFLCVLIFIFLDSKPKDSAPNNSKHSLTEICS